MKKNVLLVCSMLVFVLLASSAYAQQNPPSLLYFYIYSTSGQEYFGKYWPEKTDINKAIAMDQAAKNDNPSNMRLFEGCEDLKLRIMLNRTVPKDTTIYLKMRFTDYSNSGGVNTRAAVNLPDSIPIPSGVTYFEYPYKINRLLEAQNGGLAQIEGYTTYPNGTEYSRFSDRANFYNKFTYHLEYSPRTVPETGNFKLNIKGATSHLVCSFDGGVTWEKPQEEYTGSYITKALKVGVIYIKEPNSCLLEAIPFGNSNEHGSSSITRPVTLPNIPNAVVSHEQGIHYVSSTNNFVFTIRPTGENAGKVPVVKTDRTSIPDSEGVKIEENGDGSYKVTIMYVQQAITVSVDFATDNESIDGKNKVWANNSLLYITTSANETALIYNTAGILIKTISIDAGETVSVPLATGFYAVQLGDQTYKVILR